MAYLFFDADKNRQFDTDGAGEMGTLGEHLDYVDNHMGTPDCWDSTDTDSRIQAMDEARQSGLHLLVVDESMMRVVGRVNEPEA